MKMDAILSRIPRNPGTARLWLLLFATFFLASGFIEIAEDVFLDPIQGDFEANELDRALTSFVVQYRSPYLTQAMTDITALGSISVIFVFCVIVGALLFALKDRIGIFQLFVTVIGAGLWSAGLKMLFGRERPDLADHLVHVSDLSFPSGHSFGAAAVYTVLAFLAARHLRNVRHEVFAYVLAGVIIALVGISRIYLGVHYPTDVMAGICAGSAWTFLVSSAFLWFQPSR